MNFTQRVVLLNSRLRSKDFKIVGHAGPYSGTTDVDETGVATATAQTKVLDLSLELASEW